MRHFILCAAILSLLTACGGEERSPGGPRNQSVPAPAAPRTDKAPPLAEASLPEPPFTSESAQGAATVVETYYALIEASKYDQARALRWDRDKVDAAAFRDSFSRYAEYHATVGAPSQIQGAAGSLYVEVPVHVYGKLKDGNVFGSVGTITLRRVNDVPGSRAAERRWRIYSSD
jgi:hypothetical protein